MFKTFFPALLKFRGGQTRAEVRRAIQMVEVACGMPSLMMGDSLNDVAKEIDCKTVRQPVGVCVGITPFNFPAMVPAWMYPFAIATGNSFILKPSEKVPLTPTRAIELLHDAGLPPGVLNLVHGDKVAVDALLHHPLVKAVSFVGSTPVAKYIYTTSAAQGKRVQALGGAKNHLVVMADADMPKTVEAIIGSAFGAGKPILSQGTASTATTCAVNDYCYEIPIASVSQGVTPSSLNLQIKKSDGTTYQLPSAGSASTRTPYLRAIARSANRRVSQRSSSRGSKSQDESAASTDCVATSSASMASSSAFTLGSIKSGACGDRRCSRREIADSTGRIAALPERL